ncbi:hypothetical protein BASA50_003223 [Batrachochytrium salamandrivorans]|uniref:Kinesin motor domain-containing protein n=1 Tax=Batrachochytrium salamandrivorans TaxID=1357716 RepID=A0ABQ8FJ72_9FUNG|nr:hypothetical protein BASA50_003223 [Batrachochytrium salamandrivorans]
MDAMPTNSTVLHPASRLKRPGQGSLYDEPSSVVSPIDNVSSSAATSIVDSLASAPNKNSTPSASIRPRMVLATRSEGSAIEATSAVSMMESTAAAAAAAVSTAPSMSSSPLPGISSGRLTPQSSIQVAVRVRPISADEERRDARSAVQTEPIYSQTLSIVDLAFAAKRSSSGNALGAQRQEHKTFGFAHVFGTRTDQNRVFESAVRPVLLHCVEGHNVTVLAYGQTGSGKSFTMGTSSAQGSTAARGIIPRAADMIFDTLAAKEQDVAGFSFTARISFLEVYNDDVIDLFDDMPHISSESPVTPPGSPHPPFFGSSASNKARRSGSSSGSREPFAVRFDKQQGTVVQGIRYISASSANDVERLLVKGSLLRQTAATSANATSSRSHAIFTIIITQEYVGEAGITSRIVSKLNFVDLAGSERLKNTNAVGDRAKEGISINSGLLALGKVVNALAMSSARATPPTAASGSPNSSPSSSYIPYRDSKLTRLLQDSLGGNSQTLVIACIGPSVMDLAETKSTLQFASRAGSIRIRSTANKSDVYDKSECELHDQLRIMREQLTSAQAEAKATELKNTALGVELDLKSHLCLDMQDHIESLLNDISELRDEQFVLAETQANTSENLLRLGELERHLATRDNEVEIVVHEYQKELDKLRHLVVERDVQLKSVSQDNEVRLFEIMQRVSRIADSVELTASTIDHQPSSLSRDTSVNSGTEELSLSDHTCSDSSTIASKAWEPHAFGTKVQNFGSWLDGWLKGSTLSPSEAKSASRRRRASVVAAATDSEFSQADRLSENKRTMELSDRAAQLAEHIEARLEEDVSTIPPEVDQYQQYIQMQLAGLLAQDSELTPVERKNIHDQVRMHLSWLDGWLEGSYGAGLPIGNNAGASVDFLEPWLDGWLAGSTLTSLHRPPNDMPSHLGKRRPSIVQLDASRLIPNPDVAQSGMLIQRMVRLVERISGRLKAISDSEGNSPTSTTNSDQLSDSLDWMQLLLKKLAVPSPNAPLSTSQLSLLHGEIRVYLSWMEGWLEGTLGTTSHGNEVANPTHQTTSAQHTLQQHLLLSYFQEMEELRIRSSETDRLRNTIANRLAILESSERSLYQRSIRAHITSSGDPSVASDTSRKASSLGCKEVIDRDLEILELSKHLEELKSRYTAVLSTPLDGMTRQMDTPPHSQSDGVPPAISEFGERLSQIHSVLASQRNQQRLYEKQLVQSQDIARLQDSFTELFGKYFDGQSGAHPAHIQQVITSNRSQQSLSGDSVSGMADMTHLRHELATKDARIVQLEKMLLQREAGQSRPPNSSRSVDTDSSVAEKSMLTPPLRSADLFQLQTSSVAHTGSQLSPQQSSTLAILSPPKTALFRSESPRFFSEQITVEQHLLFSYMNDMAQAHRELNSEMDYPSFQACMFVQPKQVIRPINVNMAQHSLFQTLVSELVSIVRSTGNVHHKLQTAEARLRARDHYLQNTIMDTARQINELVNTVTDLESDKEGLISQLEGSLAERRELESTLFSLGYDVRNNEAQKLLEKKMRVVVQSTESSTQTSPDEQAESSSQWNGGRNSPYRSPSSQKWADGGARGQHGQTDWDLNAISNVTADLSGVIQQNELLQADLSLVRLQVEHLEAVGRERTAVITDLLKKMGRDESTTAERLRIRTGTINMGVGMHHPYEPTYDNMYVSPSTTGHYGADGYGASSVDYSTTRARHRDPSRPESMQSWVGTVISDRTDLTDSFV